MATVVRMPEVMANATEAVLARWVVSEGDTVAVGDPLAEVETEKALVELNAEVSGVLGRCLIEAGSTVSVGTAIAIVIEPGEGDREMDGALADGGLEITASRTPRGAAATELSPPTRASDGATLSDFGRERQFASPLARRLAHDHGLELAELSGTGPGGRVVRRDVERELAQHSSSFVAPAPRRQVAVGDAAASSYRVTPHTPMRRAIARRLSESKSSVPHFYVRAECVVDELLSLRAQVNETLTSKVSINDLVMKAVAAALVDVPEANVTWSDEELRQWDQVDLGVAIATDGGLVTPVLRHVESLSVVEISHATADLAERARGRSLRQHELEGGSFSLTNLGMFATLEFAAILNPPQSGILAVGVARPSPVAVEGEVRVANVMRCTLSVDHRAIDGALAARWLNAFQRRIERPISLLL